MKYVTRFAAVAFLGLASFARADRGIEGATGFAEIFNYCKEPVYLRSVGDKDGPESVLASGGSWKEQYKQKDLGGGPSIKIRTKGTDILQFEYTATPDKIWYDLSYVNCWIQATHSGDRCPFWTKSFVVESPGDQPHIPCATGKACNHVYHCPLDDRGAGISTIASHPVFNMTDPTRSLKLHLCPCEDDMESRECKMAQSPGMPIDEALVARWKNVYSCPETESVRESWEYEHYSWEHSKYGHQPQPIPTTLATRFGSPDGHDSAPTSYPQPHDGSSSDYLPASRWDGPA